jgi:hypothetical protein
MNKFIHKRKNKPWGGHIFMFKNSSISIVRATINTWWTLKQMSLATRTMLLVYLIFAFIGKLFFFTRPFFTIAEANLTKMIHERSGFNFWKMFDHIATGPHYRSLTLSYFLTDIASLFSLLLIAVIPVLMWLFILPMYGYTQFLLGFFNGIIISFVVLGITKILSAFSIHQPLAILQIQNPDISSGSLLSLLHKRIKKQGRINVLFLNLFYFFFFYLSGLIISLAGSFTFFSYLVMTLGYTGFLETFIFSIVYLVVWILFLLWLLPLGYLLITTTGYEMMQDKTSSLTNGSTGSFVKPLANQVVESETTPLINANQSNS